MSLLELDFHDAPEVWESYLTWAAARAKNTHEVVGIKFLPVIHEKPGVGCCNGHLGFQFNRPHLIDPIPICKKSHIFEPA